MDPQVHNGSGLRDDHLADLLVLSFLQHSPGGHFQEELQKLGRALSLSPVAWAQGPGEQHEEELQTDGSRCSHLVLQGGSPGSETQEDIIRNIARQLALIGDSMDRSVPRNLVDQLAVQFRDGRLSEEDRRTCLADAVARVVQACPRDMEAEKATLLAAMVLARKVAGHTPSLLREVFRTTVTFLNQNLLAYMRNLVGNEMD